MWKKERDALYYSSKNSGGKKSYTRTEMYPNWLISQLVNW